MCLGGTTSQVSLEVRLYSCLGDPPDPRICLQARDGTLSTDLFIIKRLLYGNGTVSAHVEVGGPMVFGVARGHISLI